MADPLQPQLSIILVAYKSLADLQRCLPSLYDADLTRVSHEVLVIDNYGQDGLSEWLSTHFPQTQYIPNPANTGYSGGNNLGLQRARGQWTLLLNPDTELVPGGLLQLVETAELNPQALINPKLLNPDGTVNACGNQMHYTGITTCRGLNEASARFTSLEPVPLLSGAALLAPTRILKQLNGFDNEYFMYFEDTDLSLRARLLGYSLLCESRAVFIHHYTLGMNATKFRYLERNRLITLLKTLSSATLWQLLPALVMSELMTWVYAVRGWEYLKGRFWGYRWIWKNRHLIRDEHRSIQRSRVISDQVLLKDSLSNLPFDQLLSPALSRFLDQVTYQLFRFLRPRSIQPARTESDLARQ